MSGAALDARGLRATRPTVGSAFFLAWRIVTYSPGRFAATLGGLGFAVLLMLAQLGFRNALLDSVVLAIEQFDAEVFVTGTKKRVFNEPIPIPRERLEQSLSVPGVAAAYPLYMDRLFYKNVEDGRLRPIRVLGANPRDPIWASPEIEAQRARLERAGTALIDRRSRSVFGRLGPGPAQIAHEAITIVGTFELGTDFDAEGNLIVSDETLFRADPRQSRGRVEMVLIRVAPGADPEAVARLLAARLPADVKARTRAQFLADEREYWNTQTPIGAVFGLGLLMGFLVGVVICYQILHNDVTDHLKEFATLKAIGYGDRYVMGVVLAEALVLATIAVLPSLAVGWLLYALVARMTGLLLALTAPRALTVVAITFGMCVVASLFAVRKVVTAEPAELFS